MTRVSTGVMVCPTRLLRPRVFTDEVELQDRKRSIVRRARDGSSLRSQATAGRMAALGGNLTYGQF